MSDQTQETENDENEKPSEDLANDEEETNGSNVLGGHQTKGRIDVTEEDDEDIVIEDEVRLSEIYS